MSDLTSPFSEVNKPEVRSRYYDGTKNRFIRIYYYLHEGLDLLNQFKYLVAGILAFYYFLKTDNLRLMVLMFVVAIPLLTLAGWLWTHQAKKVIEFFSLKYTTHFGQYGIRLQEKQLELHQTQVDMLAKLNEKIEELSDTISANSI